MSSKGAFEHVELFAQQLDFSPKVIVHGVAGKDVNRFELRAALGITQENGLHAVSQDRWWQCQFDGPPSLGVLAHFGRGDFAPLMLRGQLRHRVGSGEHAFPYAIDKAGLRQFQSNHGQCSLKFGARPAAKREIAQGNLVHFWAFKNEVEPKFVHAFFIQLGVGEIEFHRDLPVGNR